MKNELKKLGLRIRPRVVKPRVQKDDEARALPGFTIVEDEGPANAPIRSNPKGLRNGYNPYESGLLAKKGPRRQVDLRELSKWMEAKKNAKTDGHEE